MAGGGSSVLGRRVVVVHKPDDGRLTKLRHELQKLTLDAIFIETNRDADITEHLVTQTIRSGDFVISHGGDGTTGIVGNALLSSPRLKDIIFLPLHGGNACDIATMLNGTRGLSHILEHGRAVECHPLEVTIRGPDKVVLRRYALAYFSVGASAWASLRFNIIGRRATHLPRLGLRPAYEKTVVWHVLSSYGKFKLRLSPEAREESVADIVFATGNRVAKYGKTHASITKKEYEWSVSKTLNHATSVNAIVRLSHGTYKSDIAGDLKTFWVTALDNKELPVQFDGEAQPILSGSKITVQIAPRSYTALSTT